VFSASSETRDRNAPTNANQIRLQTSRIGQEHRPIRYQLPARLSFRQGQVSVTDCGVGISAENADRLFNAFFTTKSSGMGMGLSICRTIMEAHGGRLWATANRPHGATFQFALPANGDAAL
jgi:signal transduction histidine kinase